MTRLHLTPLSLHHSEFILTLLNTSGWLRFIGDRKVNNTADAQAYITKITDSPKFTYWVAELKDTAEPIGIITLIERDYLPHPDIGFAFLPEYSGKGYAFEAATGVLNSLFVEKGLSRLLAITLPDNMGSVGLLKKLEFWFEREIVVEGERLEVYGLSS